MPEARFKISGEEYVILADQNPFHALLHGLAQDKLVAHAAADPAVVMLQSGEYLKAVLVVLVEGGAAARGFRKAQAYPVCIKMNVAADLVIKTVKGDAVICQQETIQVEFCSIGALLQSTAVPFYRFFPQLLVAEPVVDPLKHGIRIAHIHEVHNALQPGFLRRISASLGDDDAVTYGESLV